MALKSVPPDDMTKEGMKVGSWGEEDELGEVCDGDRNWNFGYFRRLGENDAGHQLLASVLRVRGK